MQIICKVREGRIKDAEEIITKKLNAVLPKHSIADVTVKQVFPGLTTGQRARLFSIDLPDGLSDQEISEVVEELRKEEALEYATLPAPKRPM